MIAGQVKVMPYMALKGEVESTWYYGARVVDPEFKFEDGKVHFGVVSPGDTVVQRTSGELSGGDPVAVPIELVALSLTSVEPITVNVGGENQAWVVNPVVDVEKMDSPLPAPPGLFPQGAGLVVIDPPGDNTGITLEDIRGQAHPSTDVIRHGLAFPLFAEPMSQDTILGSGCGDDLIRGGPGDDDLFGQPGDDVIIGDPGNDLLSGPDGWTAECQEGPREEWTGAVGVWVCTAGPPVPDDRFNADWYVFSGPGEAFQAFYPRDPFNGGNFIVEVFREPGQQGHLISGNSGPALIPVDMGGIVLTNPENNCRGAIFSADSFFDVFTEIEIDGTGGDDDLRVAPGQEVRYLGASPFRGGTADDWYGFECECGSMDRRDEDPVNIDLTSLPGPDTIRGEGGDDFVMLE